MEIDLIKSENNEYFIKSIELDYTELTKSFINQIVKHFEKLIKKTEKKIEKINNNPKNEGQAYFLEEIYELQTSVEYYNRKIKEIKSYPLHTL